MTQLISSGGHAMDKQLQALQHNLEAAVQRAMESCKASGHEASDHFRGVTKMVELGSGSKGEIDNFMLTRYACYLIAQNGDPRKPEIALAKRTRTLPPQGGEGP